MVHRTVWLAPHATFAPRRSSAAFDREDRRQKFKTFAKPLTLIFERHSGDRIVPAKKHTSHATGNAVMEGRYAQGNRPTGQLWFLSFTRQLPSMTNDKLKSGSPATAVAPFVKRPSSKPRRVPENPFFSAIANASILSRELQVRMLRLSNGCRASRLR